MTVFDQYVIPNAVKRNEEYVVTRDSFPPVNRDKLFLVRMTQFFACHLYIVPNHFV